MAVRKKLVRETKRIYKAKLNSAIAWYKPEQWDLLLKVSEDKDKLEATHSEWERTAEKTLERFSKKGMHFMKVLVDVNDLVKWCKSKKISVNGEARAEYAAVRMRNMNKNRRKRRN